MSPEGTAPQHGESQRSTVEPGPSIRGLIAELAHRVLGRLPDGIVIGLVIATFAVLGAGFLVFVVLQFGLGSGTS